MNRINEQSWPAQEPSANFAEATVERMLASPVSSVAKTTVHPRLVWLLVAAVLVSGAALGVALQGRTHHASRARESLPTASQVSAPAKPPAVLAPAALVAPALPSSKPSSERKPVAAVAAPPKAPSTVPAPSKPKVPACNCQRGYSDVICDCY